MADNENLENEEMKKKEEATEMENTDLENKVEENTDVSNEKGSEENIKLEDIPEEIAPDEMEQQLAEAEDRYKRLFAEFENYKKRNLKEKESLRNMLVSDIMTSILPIIDNLEKAIAAGTDDSSYEEGIKMILKQLKDVLAFNGVKEIETVGHQFDPELHEAVSHVTDDKLGPNTIKEEFRKGYIIGTKVIRHSMVIVAN